MVEEAGPVPSFVSQQKGREEVSRRSRLNPDLGRIFVALLERLEVVLVSLCQTFLCFYYREEL